MEIDILAEFPELKSAHVEALAGADARDAEFEHATSMRRRGEFVPAAAAYRALATANPGRFGAVCHRAARACDRSARK